jgi:cell division protein FtsZ
VSIEPYDPGPYAAIAEAAEQLQEAQPETAPPARGPYIPPAPEVPTPRIPRIEDFPPHVQREIEAQRHPRNEEERGPLSLLRRLAGVGLSRREEVAAPPPAAEPAAPRPAARAAAPPARPQRVAQPPRAAAQSYRPAEGNLDPQGRSLPARAQEDELEIPAFLRRQSS